MKKLPGILHWVVNTQEGEASVDDGRRPRLQLDLLDLLGIELQDREKDVCLYLLAIDRSEIRVVSPRDGESSDEHDLSEERALWNKQQLRKELRHEEEGARAYQALTWEENLLKKCHSRMTSRGSSLSSVRWGVRRPRRRRRGR